MLYKGAMRAVPLFAALAAWACVASSDPPRGPAEHLERAYETVNADPAVAIAHLDAALSATGDDALRLDALELRAHGHLSVGDPELALSDFDAALELAPEDAWLHYGRGTAFEMMERYDDALDSFLVALEIDPLHVKSWEWSGYVHALRGEHVTAVEEYGQAMLALDATTDEQLAEWSEDRALLWVELLDLRSQSLEQLGQHAAAQLDRAEIERITGRE